MANIENEATITAKKQTTMALMGKGSQKLDRVYVEESCIIRRVQF